MKIVSLLFFLIIAGCSPQNNEQKEGIASFEPTWESLSKHEIPEWLLDAKFGIYAHWGPYSVPAYGSEWYANRMHQKGSDINKYHIETYGEPWDYPYHKFISEFKAEKFDANEWADLIEKSGAKYGGFAVGHHDGFLLYDSDVSRWCAGKMGPHRDLFGDLTSALREKGIKTIATFHLLRTFNWYLPQDEEYLQELKRNGSPLFDPEYADFYWNEHTSKYADFLDNWKAKVKEVTDKYKPDVVWFDGGKFQEDQALKNTLDVLAYYYNSGKENNQEVEVLNKLPGTMTFNFPMEIGVLTFEEGRDRKGFVDWPWIDDQRIALDAWGYTKGQKYRSSNEILHGLIDRVSRGGGLLLSLSPMADGSINEPQKEILINMGNWLKENGEAIYGTSKWKIQVEGQGDDELISKENRNKWDFKNCTAEDIRFTHKDNTLFAIALGVPGDRTIKIKSLSFQTKISESNKIQQIELLGAGQVNWRRDNTALFIELPDDVPNAHALAFKIIVDGVLDN